MTRTDTEIRFIRGNSGFGPMPYGKFSGQPTVSLKLSSSDQNAMKVNSLESLYASRNWKRKLSSGYARLRIFGDAPLSESHKEGLEYLFDVIDPRFVDMEIEDKYLDTQPSRAIQNKTDTYSFFIDGTKDSIKYDFDTMEYMTGNIANKGNAQYIFKVDSVTCENRIKNFAKEYNVYDSDIWLYPAGRKRRTVEENRESVTNVAKRNTWNVSPRLDVLMENEEETD